MGENNGSQADLTTTQGAVSTGAGSTFFVLLAELLPVGPWKKIVPLVGPAFSAACVYVWPFAVRHVKRRLAIYRWEKVADDPRTPEETRKALKRILHHARITDASSELMVTQNGESVATHEPATVAIAGAPAGDSDQGE